MTQRKRIVGSYTVTSVEPSNNGEEYIGETSRTLGECYREHLKEPSPIHECSLYTCHQLNPDLLNIIGMEDLDLSRLIKESIYIRVNNPTLN